MDINKYYKVKIHKSGLNWLTTIHYDINEDFWYSLEKRAMVFSAKLFKTQNRLTDFLKDKEYEMILVDDIKDIKPELVIDYL